MSLNENLPPLIIILGPTAVGKTEYSISLAEHFNGEIVSADSRLLYRGMNIGTAKPSLNEQGKVKHYLIDVANPDEIWSLAQYQFEAVNLIEEIHSRKKTPFLVGGTGQYIRAIKEGWDIPKFNSDPVLRDIILNWTEKTGKLGIWERLKVLDPQAAEIIDYRNTRRIIRAMEVIFKTGKKFSEQRQKSPPAFKILQIGLYRPTDELYERIDKRVDLMFENGFVDEVKSLLAEGYSQELPSMSAIGYSQIIQHLNGELEIDEAVQLIKKATRKFVRHQRSWFRLKDPDIFWFEVNPNLLDQLTYRVKEFLDL